MNDLMARLQEKFWEIIDWHTDQDSRAKNEDLMVRAWVGSLRSTVAHRFANPDFENWESRRDEIKVWMDQSFKRVD